jgi:hypothetical protein
MGEGDRANARWRGPTISLVSLKLHRGASRLTGVGAVPGLAGADQHDREQGQRDDGE